MPFWNIKLTDKFDTKYQRFEKNYEEEIISAWDNLDSYLRALQRTDNPLKVNSGYIHPETKGIVAIDQSKADRKLREIRLYVYPDTKTKTLLLLTIGDKRTQQKDIKFAVNCIEKYKGR
ncbi:MAG: hypothetical protein P9M04_02950 [Candidatus Orphnella occulta]|nr:hypothetical protein [Candidatus Orphnella occulta]